MIIIFFFHRIHHENRSIYVNAIRAQNSYLATSRVIPITGISPDAMFYLEKVLMQVPGVKQILLHKKTIQQGRYSIMTNEAAFKTVAKTVRENISTWNENVTVANAIITPLGYPEPSVAFNHAFDDDSDSGTSMNTYLSACSTIFTAENEVYDAPPVSTIVPVQAWASQPIRTPFNPPMSTAISSITEGEIMKKNEEIEQLNKQVNALMKQNQLLLDSQKRQNLSTSVAMAPLMA